MNKGIRELCGGYAFAATEVVLLVKLGENEVYTDGYGKRHDAEQRTNNKNKEQD